MRSVLAGSVQQSCTRLTNLPVSGAHPDAAHGMENAKWRFGTQSQFHCPFAAVRHAALYNHQENDE